MLKSQPFLSKNTKIEKYKCTEIQKMQNTKKWKCKKILKIHKTLGCHPLVQKNIERAKPQKIEEKAPAPAIFHRTFLGCIGILEKKTI